MGVCWGSVMSGKKCALFWHRRLLGGASSCGLTFTRGTDRLARTWAATNSWLCCGCALKIFVVHNKNAAYNNEAMSHILALMHLEATFLREMLYFFACQCFCQYFYQGSVW